ncbi:MAG TPA: DinB family protein [Chloroflexia bacterium]|nr:DinB family protein [Chloroflexia bacterium]
MDAVTLLREQLKTAHWVLEGTMADVTPEQMDWAPPGIANPLGASYAHTVTSEDMVINGMLREGAPLFASAWAGKTGSNEPMPRPGPDWEKYGSWARNVQVDLPAAREYAQAVYASSDEYLAGLTPEALDTQLDLSGIGMGQVSLASAISLLVIGHINNLAGEISCLKGIQGAKGYPF